MTKTAVIFDLDGCVCDDAWRLMHIKPYLGKTDEAYADYHSKCSLDAVLACGKEAILEKVAAGHQIAFFTARPFKYIEQTKIWIRTHLQIPDDNGYVLCMREDNDHRPSVEVKRDMLALLHRTFPEIEIVEAYDDREDIVEMYRQEGLAANVLDKQGIHVSVAAETAATEEENMSVFDQEQMRDWLTRVSSMNKKEVKADQLTPDELLAEAAATFRASNEVYKNNYVQVGQILAIMFPDGIQLNTADDHTMYSIMVQLIGKLTRFGNTGLTHQDSIRDLTVYAAIAESLLK